MEFDILSNRVSRMRPGGALGAGTSEKIQQQGIEYPLADGTSLV